MAEQSTPARVGQEEDPFIALLGRHTGAIVRMTAVLTKLSGRLDALETRLDIPKKPADEDAPVPFAIGIDGRALLHVDHVDMSDGRPYPTWEGVMLSEQGTAELLTYAADGAFDAAAKMGAWLKKMRQKASETAAEGEEP